MTPEAAEGWVMTGGQSRRMGQDKAAMLLAGLPLLAHMLGKLQAAGVSGRVAGASIPGFPAYIFAADARPGCGPVSGVATALRLSRTPLVLVLGIDLPLLSVSLLMALLERARITQAAATIPRALGRPQPLCAVYRAELEPAIAHQLEVDTRNLMLAVEQAAAQVGSIVDCFDVEELVAAGSLPLDRPALWEFLNCNTPTELAMAERLLDCESAKRNQSRPLLPARGAAML
jgi:molybdopterin-guanine dinucleotide biosynthesis protein A